MDARGILEKIKLKQKITPGEARWFGQSLAGTAISDAQAGAFAMAVCMNGLDPRARVGLTQGMRDSGDVLSWDLPGPVLDKHSTGGVGDPVSLLLAPALAELGAFVPMISGRGLGHTGGTLDKLEAIPGYVSEIGPSRLEHVVREVGAAIVGATGRVAPSDKRLYAIRDVSSTVASIDLITASILSKKLAAGLDGLVLDVKTGSGAFLGGEDEARALADSLVGVANGAGCKTEALLTDMSQPLADAAGNAVEIRAVMDCLTGQKPNPRLLEVTCALGGVLLATGGLASDTEDGFLRMRAVLESGAVAERFGRMVASLGGPSDFLESWRYRLPEASVLKEVYPIQAGYVHQINARVLGQVVVNLGGGRKVESDKIDPAVGVSQIVSVGAKVDPKIPIAMVHAATEEHASEAAVTVRKAISIGGTPVAAPQVVQGLISP